VTRVARKALREAEQLKPSSTVRASAGGSA
jgi:hypothetical protein